MRSLSECAKTLVRMSAAGDIYSTRLLSATGLPGCMGRSLRGMGGRQGRHHIVPQRTPKCATAGLH
jgi:hypothetical protein